MVFPTYEKAMGMARHFSSLEKYKRDDQRLVPYRCYYCEGWHLGHEPPEIIRRFARGRQRWNWRKAVNGDD
jgi:hypothetical protein